MNKIILESTKIKEINLDKNIQYTLKKNLIPLLEINVLKDTSLIIEFKKESNLNISINVNKGVNFSLSEIKTGLHKILNNYNLQENSTIKVIKINDVEKIKEQDIINLDGKNAKIDYLLKTISKSDEKYDVIVNHNKENTTSNIINHGVNIKEGKLKFEVSSFIPKNVKKCNANQNNRIINLNNKKCQIKPNLFIDENDVVANHSAHIGKCNEKEMFYLQSRGINEKDAESLIIRGFLMQKLDNIDIISDLINKYW